MTPTSKLTIGIVLTASAGFIDAIGFVRLGGFYTSFMSGNTTQTGASLAQGDLTAVILPMTLIVGFFLGSFLGSLTALASGRWASPSVLLFVLFMIAMSMALGFAAAPLTLPMAALACAAGAQNAVIAPSGSARLGTTFVTGTLFAAGQDLARATRGEAPSKRWLQHLLVWLSLMLGAAGGAIAYRSFSVAALLIPAAVYATVMIGFFVVIGWRSTSSQKADVPAGSESLFFGKS